MGRTSGSLILFSLATALGLALAVSPFPDPCAGTSTSLSCAPDTSCAPTDAGPACLAADRSLKMFLTQQRFSAREFGSVHRANQWCQITAKGAVGAQPGDVYFAFVSNSTNHPRTSFYLGGSRYVNKQGVVVFASTAHIFQNMPLLATLTQHEDTAGGGSSAVAPQPAAFWTGTNSYGEPYLDQGPSRASFDCWNWVSTSGAVEGSVGLNSLAAGASWATAMTQDCTVPAHLLCVQQNVVSTACAANPCSADQTCVPLLEDNSFECVANPIPAIAQCAPTTCANGATCVDYVTSHKCFCAAGFTGTDCSEPVVTSTNPPPAPLPGYECFAPFGKQVKSSITEKFNCDCEATFGFTESRCVQCHGVTTGEGLTRACVSSFSNANCGFEGRACTGVKQCTLVDQNAQCVVPDGVPDCEFNCVGGQVCRFVGGVAACTPPDEPTVCSVQCETGFVCQFEGGNPVCVAVPPATCATECSPGFVCQFEGGYPICVPVVPVTCSLECAAGYVCQFEGGNPVCVSAEATACTLACEAGQSCQFEGGNQVCAPEPVQPEVCTPGCSEGQICTGLPGEAWSCVPAETTTCTLACEVGQSCQFEGGNQVCAPTPLQPEVCTPGCSEGQICTGPPGEAWSCVTPPPSTPLECLPACEAPYICKTVNGETLCAEP